MTELGNYEAQNTLRYFLSYFNGFGGNLGNTAGFEEENYIAAAEKEAA
jgi:hypothetical protein